MANFNSVRNIKRITAILGASDPEMEMIENLLRECGVTVIHALNERGERVRPNEAYRVAIPDVGDAGEVWAIECIGNLPEGWIRIDHHRPGDPGHGQGPENFLKASSIGQVIGHLAQHDLIPRSWKQKTAYAMTMRSAGIGCVTGSLSQVMWGTRNYDNEPWYVAIGSENVQPYGSRQWAKIPVEYVLCAAADHCLAHAYAGRCPGVTREDLLDWRIASKAKFTGKPEADIRKDILFARDALQKAPKIQMGNESIADTRNLRVITGFYGSCGSITSRRVAFDARACGVKPSPIGDDILTRVESFLPELPEGGTLEGIPYLAVGLGGPDGKTKVICQGASPETITYFMETWGPENGLTEIYGMPERGIAGGYLVKE